MVMGKGKVFRGANAVQVVDSGYCFGSRGADKVVSSVLSRCKKERRLLVSNNTRALVARAAASVASPSVLCYQRQERDTPACADPPCPQHITHNIQSASAVLHQALRQLSHAQVLLQNPLGSTTTTQPTMVSIQTASCAIRPSRNSRYIVFRRNWVASGLGGPSLQHKEPSILLPP
jgi:hypothetical protein